MTEVREMTRRSLIGEIVIEEGCHAVREDPPCIPAQVVERETGDRAHG